MNAVEPIRDLEVYNQIADDLLQKSERDHFMLRFGCNSALRISDLLQLKVSDVKKENINIREKKTRKQKTFPINPKLRKIVNHYIKNKKDDDYLFASRKGKNKPIGRVQAYKIIKKACNERGVENVGTHTMRKTFAYHHYMKYKDVALLQKILNHRDPKETLIYIGVIQDRIDSSMMDMFL